MSYPTYFSQFPNSKYAISVNRSGRADYLKIKDFYRLMRVRDDIYTESSLYVPYVVSDGERPENISYKFYNDEQYYWIILQVNDIIDYYNSWSLSLYEFEKFILRKYGSWDNASRPHHWETTEAVTEDGIIMMPAGLVVSENFKYTYLYSSSQDSFIEKTVLPVEVSNVEYERKLNDDKKSIRVLNRKYVADYVRETYKFATNLPAVEDLLGEEEYFR